MVFNIPAIHEKANCLAEQERFGCMNAMDGKTELQMLSYVAPKIRLLRSMSIQNESMQVTFLMDLLLMYSKLLNSLRILVSEEKWKEKGL